MDADSNRPILRRLRSATRRFRKDQRGNVLMILGLSIVPLTFATGMGIDYSRAMRLQTKLNAAADAAALSAVTQSEMSRSSADACAVARRMFITQMSGLDGLVLDPTDADELSITITDSASGTGGGTSTACTSSGSSSGTTASFSRTASVSYHALSKNAFAGILGMSTLAIHGSSKAYSAVAPNIDFYLMLDTSPSMLLPATTSGLSSLLAATGDCTFACHQTNLVYNDPANKNNGKLPKYDPTKPANTEIYCTGPNKTNCIDYYQLARNKGIILRTDLVTTAVQDLTGVASSTAAKNKAQYRMGLFDFDYQFRTIWPLSKSSDGRWVDASMPTVQSHVADAKVLVYSENNNRVYNVSDNDTATKQVAAFNAMTKLMPNPGNGTNSSGDTPQEILFVITDGMRDESRPGGKPEGPFNTNVCDTIKAKGIRIAILNTQYLPDSASGTWSINNVKTPYLSPTDKITPALQQCASPGLFYQVTTDGDISAALTSLFQQAVATAHLTQ